MVRPNAWQAGLILSNPLSMSERGNFVRVRNLTLTELANVVRGRPNALPVRFPLFGLGVVPSDLLPLQLDVLGAMRTGDVIPPLISPKITLPDSAF